MEPELREALQTLGLRTAGAFAALAPVDVEQRWGPAGLGAWRLARADDTRRPGLARAEGARVATAELATSTETTEPLVFLVRGALDRLVQDCVRDGRAAAAVAITLVLDDARGAIPSAGARAHTITREVRPARPLARVAPLLELCQSLLSQWALPAPVSAIAVTIAATAPLTGDQGDLLDASWRDAGAAEAALARLRADLGAGSVVTAVARDAHAPEQAAAWEDAGTRSADLTTQAPRGDAQIAPAIGLDALTPSADADANDPPPPRALRLLTPPEPVEIELAADRPVALHWRARRVSIVHASGPERLAGTWWQSPYTRDYWRCALDRDAEVMVFADRAPVDDDGAAVRQWFVQGWYD
jgi:protein ImuB